MGSSHQLATQLKNFEFPNTIDNQSLLLTENKHTVDQAVLFLKKLHDTVYDDSKIIDTVSERYDGSSALEIVEKVKSANQSATTSNQSTPQTNNTTLHNNKILFLHPNQLWHHHQVLQRQVVLLS